METSKVYTGENAKLLLQGKEYKFFVRGRVFYYDFLREDAMKRRFINFEKILSVRGTARTWKVVNKLMALLK